MKSFTSQAIAVLRDRELRQNFWALGKTFLVLAVFIAIYSVVFHLLMLAEGQNHSWLTGVYWTLTVMSTLGFGDITFHTDAGRLFSMLVLLTGVVLLLIVLPFSFIRHFYAPWMEAQLRLKAPREVPAEMTGHIIIAELDAVAQALIARLRQQQIPYVLIEPDPARALSLHLEGIHVIVGEPDSVATWNAARARFASLVVANKTDPENTAITLTVRELAEKVPVAAIVSDEDAIDILELSGATNVIALRQRLGQHLAAHADVGTAAAHHVGQFGDLSIAEVPIRRTDLGGRTVRESKLSARTGVHVVSSWERGKLVAANADLLLTDDSIIVVVGTERQVQSLNALVSGAVDGDDPALIIGGGAVGRAAARALKEKGVHVAVIEQDASLESIIRAAADEVIIGSAADINVMKAGGIESASAVLLTTHDDAINIYLALYARRLNPECHIVSRITHERNLESIHRAGANFVLSESSLGAKLLLSVYSDREFVVVGEEVDVFTEPMPKALSGKRFGECHIGEKTGIRVVGTRRKDVTDCDLEEDTLLDPDADLVMFGTRAQRKAFREQYGD